MKRLPRCLRQFRLLVRGTPQIARYLVIGGIAWVMDVATFAVSYPIVGIAAGQAGARMVGAFVGFAGHKLFVFSDKTRAVGGVLIQALSYSVVWVISYVISLGALLVLIDVAQLHPVAAKIISEAVVVGSNFFMFKYFVFRTKGNLEGRL